MVDESESPKPDSCKPRRATVLQSPAPTAQAASPFPWMIDDAQREREGAAD